MVRVDPDRAVRLYLLWLGALCAALILSLSDVLPFRLSFVRPDNLLNCFTLIQVFFMVLVWPLRIPALLETPEAGRSPRLIPEIVVLIVLSLPPALVCANVSDTGAGAVVRGQTLVASVGGFVAGLFALARDRGWRIGPWYFLAAFALSAALPFLAFLSVQFGEGGLGFIAVANPFWGALRLSGPGSLIQAAVFAGLAASLGAAGRTR